MYLLGFSIEISWGSRLKYLLHFNNRTLPVSLSTRCLTAPQNRTLPDAWKKMKDCHTSGN